MDFTVDNAAAVVRDSVRDTPDPRLREVLERLIEHVHAFVREVRPSMDEWERAIGFLTAVGQRCDETRQEFVLLSDVLGVSMAVETLNAQTAGTEGTVLGPFHLTASPRRELGDSIDLVGTDTPCVVTGSVRGTDGSPLPGAQLDVWQSDGNGFYDVQQPDVQPPGNGRGLFRADAEGRFWFRTVRPAPYPVPTDGPVGALLAATGRHPYRPAHIHFIAEAPGHRGVTTHAFVAGGKYLDSDAVFGVKRSLIVDFATVTDERAAAGYGVTAPFTHAHVDLVLQPVGAG